MKSNHNSIIEGKAQRHSMMRRLLTLTIALSLCLPFAIAGDDAGVNRTIDVDGTPIDSITAPEISTDGVNFTISLTLVTKLLRMELLWNGPSNSASIVESAILLRKWPWKMQQIRQKIGLDRLHRSIHTHTSISTSF